MNEVEVKTEGAYSSSIVRLDDLSTKPFTAVFIAKLALCGLATCITKANLHKIVKFMSSYKMLGMWIYLYVPNT